MGASEDAIQIQPARFSGLQDAERRAERALAEVGELHLAHEAARRRQHELSGRLEAARRRARQALSERTLAYEALMEGQALPEGEWVLNGERGELVRRKG
jgi:hypothetical protein